MSRDLTAEEQLLYERFGPLFEQERLRMAKALASKADTELFGVNEYQVRGTECINSEPRPWR